MAQILKSLHPITNTAEHVPKEQIEKDVKHILDIVYGGGVAILPLDVAYAIIGSKESAIKRIFTAKKRSYEKPSGLVIPPQVNWGEFNRSVQRLFKYFCWSFKSQFFSWSSIKFISNFI